jgi:fused signal recognition particle receptor
MPDKSKFKFSLWPWKSTKQENHPDSNAIDEPQQQQTENITPKNTELSIDTQEPEQVITTNNQSEQQVEALATETKKDKIGLFGRVLSGLKKTRNSFIKGITTLFSSRSTIDEELFDELEELLLIADIGAQTTTEIMDQLQAEVKSKNISDPQYLLTALKQQLADVLNSVEKPLTITPKHKMPFVILTVGVNGAGKTTTIGKLAHKFKHQGYKVMLAAGDTFRAAATEQLNIWAERNSVAIVAQQQGSDSASVIYDAVQSAIAKDVDILIADTAGRLHNKSHLMEELKKIKRVLQKIDPAIPQEILLVVDAGTGQNALNQAKIFDEAVGLTSLALTKLDGTAKGGIIFSLSKTMKLPIRFIGVGEKIDDLRDFSAKEFTDALFTKNEQTTTIES